MSWRCACGQKNYEFVDVCAKCNCARREGENVLWFARCVEHPAFIGKARNTLEEAEEDVVAHVLEKHGQGA